MRRRLMNWERPRRETLDCFASFAMTVEQSQRFFFRIVNLTIDPHA